MNIEHYQVKVVVKSATDMMFGGDGGGIEPSSVSLVVVHVESMCR